MGCAFAATTKVNIEAPSNATRNATRGSVFYRVGNPLYK